MWGWAMQAERTGGYTERQTGTTNCSTVGHPVCVLRSLSALPPLGQGPVPLENPGEEVAREGCVLFT